jgi:hypothetical protein
MINQGGREMERRYRGALFGFDKVILIALGAAVWLALYMHAPTAPILAADSASYLRFASNRTAGYPLFLAAFGTQGTLVLQPIVAAATVTFLGWQMMELCGSLVAALALMLLSCVNPPLLAYHYMILTESPFVSLLMILLGLFMRLAQRPSYVMTILASAIAGLAIAMRPAGWFLLLLMPMLALLVQNRTLGGARSKPLLLIASTLPLLAVAAGERGLSSVWHGGRTPGSTTASILDINFTGKAGMINGPPSDESRDARVFAFAFAPVRQLISTAPDWAIGRFLEINYETCLEYACAHAIGIDPASPATRQAALARLRANPGQFIQLAWQHYKSLWTIYSITTPEEHARLENFFARHTTLPFEKQVSDLRAPLKPAPHFARLAQLSLAAICVIAGFLALRGISALVFPVALTPVWTMAIVAALLIEGAFALTALVGLGIARYMLVMWPAMMVMVECAFLSAVQRFELP